MLCQRRGEIRHLFLRPKVLLIYRQSENGPEAHIDKMNCRNIFSTTNSAADTGTKRKWSRSTHGQNEL